MKNRKEAKDYLTPVGFEFEQFERIGYTSLPVLPFLIGHAWDDFALSLVQSLEPSYLRVTYGEVVTDSRSRRVTVVVDMHMIIREISQELCVGLIPGVQHGYDLRMLAEKRGIKL